MRGSISLLAQNQKQELILQQSEDEAAAEFVMIPSDERRRGGGKHDAEDVRVCRGIYGHFYNSFVPVYQQSPPAKTPASAENRKLLGARRGL